MAVMLGETLLSAAGYSERLRQSNSSAPSIMAAMLGATLLLGGVLSERLR